LTKDTESHEKGQAQKPDVRGAAFTSSSTSPARRFYNCWKKKDVQAGLKRKAKYSMPSWAESPKIENNLKRYAE
jgi:hypothetical protein